MNYTITFDKSTKDEPVLVVSRPGGWSGAPDIQVVKVFTGGEAVALWSLLTKDKTEQRNKEGKCNEEQSYMVGVDALIAAKRKECEDCVSKAIKTIVTYCSERGCNSCRMYSSEGCVFKCGYPFQWLEVQKELKEGAKIEGENE